MRQLLKMPSPSSPTSGTHSSRTTHGMLPHDFGNSRTLDNGMDVSTVETSSIPTTTMATTTTTTTTTTHSFGQDVDNIPSPSAYVFDPKAQFEDYLKTLHERLHSRSGSSTATSTGRDDSGIVVSEKDIDEILLVAEDLFGLPMLNATLAVLDAKECGIVKVSSAHRAAYIVKGTQADSYLCLCRPTTTAIPNNNNNKDNNNHHLRNEGNAVDYCSCRSFREKNNNRGIGIGIMGPIGGGSVGSGRIGGGGTSLEWCKHLLALKLLPFLLPPSACNEITLTTEDQFANLVLDRTMSHR